MSSKLRMVRAMLVSDFQGVDNSDEREIRAAETMYLLLHQFDPVTAVALALTRRGDDRIIQNADAHFFKNLIEVFGVDDGWTAAFCAGLFSHPDRPLMPGFSFDLNSLSDAMCLDRFRYSIDIFYRIQISNFVVSI